MNLPIKSVDVLHYYFGCEFVFRYHYNGENIIGKVESLNDQGFMCGHGYSVSKKEKTWYEIDDVRKDGEIKLILTDPRDLNGRHKTIKEYRALCKISEYLKDTLKIRRISDTPLSIHHCLLNHIDMFELIENGQAISKKIWLSSDLEERGLIYSFAVK